MATDRTIRTWILERLPDDLFDGEPEVTIDKDEILVVGPIAPPDLDDEADDEDREAARDARISKFREATRKQRMGVARQAEQRFDRKVSWGVRVGDTRALFTHLSVPVMTRLRITERAVLDTLLDAGVARSRSDALAWCVRWVARNQDEWLTELRDAFTAVEEVRAKGPDA